MIYKLDFVSDGLLKDFETTIKPEAMFVIWCMLFLVKIIISIILANEKSKIALSNFLALVYAN